MPTSTSFDLYTWTTPNGYKVSIALEELGLSYTAIPVNIAKGEQFTPDYVALNPNSKIPVLRDRERDFVLSESVAILKYLGEKTGKLYSADWRTRARTDQWLFFQAASVGPMMGQYNHFKVYAPVKIPYGIERYETESLRILKVLNTQLREHEYLAGTQYSIADIATWPWIHSIQRVLPGCLEHTASLRHWYDAIHARPAVKKGLSVPAPK